MGDSNKGNGSAIDPLISIMSWYVNKIVSQGDGIVATLEHLKQFFLSNNGSALDQYNEKNINASTNPNIPARLNINSNTPHNLEFSLNSNKYNIYMNGRNEVKEAGKFMDFQMFPTLNALKTDNPRSTSKYVMLCQIIRGNPRSFINEAVGTNDYLNAFNADLESTNKYWQAAIDSLEFAQSVSSTANAAICKNDLISSTPEQNGGFTLNNRIRKRTLKKKKRNSLKKKKQNKRKNQKKLINIY